MRLPVWFLVFFCCVLPGGWMLFQLLAHREAAADVHVTAFHLRLLGRTLLYNGITAIIATAISLPAALVLGRGGSRLAKILAFLLPLPLLLPSITYAYGWSQVLRLCDIALVPASGGDVARCIWTLATWLWPLPAGVIGLSLRRVDANLQQQALLDGAYWRVMLRQLAGPIAAGCAMVLVIAMQEFSVYEPTGISVVATEIRSVFETGVPNLTSTQMTSVGPGSDLFPVWDQPRRAAAAITTAIPLLIAIALLVAFSAWAVRKASAAADTIDDGPWPRVLDAGPWATLGAMCVLLLTVVLPACCMVGSIHRPMNLARMYVTFEPYLLGSLLISGLGFIVAWVAAKGSSLARARAPLVLAVLTFLIGGQLLAIAQIRLYNHRNPRWLFECVYNAPTIVVMTHFARFGWVAMLAGLGTWSQPWKELRAVAAVDGADAWATARWIVWPLARPVLVASGVLVMVLSLTEVPATVLLQPQRPQVFTPLLMTWVHTLRSDDMLEGSLLLMGAAVLLGLLAVTLLTLRRRWVSVSARVAAIILIVSITAMSGGCWKSAQPDDVWSETGAGSGQVVYPRGITYSPKDDTFFIVDRMARIQHFDRAGKFLNGWRMPQWENGKPVGLSIGPDGNLYVPDTHYSRVVVYTPEGKEVRRFGKNGRGPGEFIYPTDIAWDKAGNTYVSEYGDNDRVQVFDAAGHVLRQFGKFGTGNGEFNRPQSMLIDGEVVYLTDACNHRICVFKTDGTWVRNMGQVGSGLGDFRFPYGLDQDRDGHLIVCEFGNNRVQKIDKQTGRGLAAWGTGGREPGQLAYPWGVAVDKKDRIVVVDSGNNRLQVFGF